MRFPCWFFFPRIILFFEIFVGNKMIRLLCPKTILGRILLLLSSCKLNKQPAGKKGVLFALNIFSRYICLFIHNPREV